jgi:stage V sporulation protein SpoVS
MTTKKKTLPAKQNKQSESEKFANVSLSASYMGAILADSFTSTILPETKIADVASALSDKITTIQAGDMQPIEAMLISQAHALQTMFVTLGRMAASKTQLAQYTAFMNMALKAQSQSRATIQALTELKYPKQATFVKQANISHGHQQVNNATNTHAPAHAQENQQSQNKLLEAQQNEWLDNGKTATPSATNQAVATVAT